MTGRDLYPSRRDLWFDLFWRCDPCKAWVGTDRHGNALGRPGNQETRAARSKLHDDRFDPIWKAGMARYSGTGLPAGRIQATCRHRLYRYLAHLMGLELEETHIALFSLDQCRQAWTVLRGVTYEDARDFVKAEADRHDTPPA